MQSMLKPFLGLVLVAGIAGAAQAQAQAPFAKAEDAIKYRKSAMFVMAQHFGRLGPVVKGERPYNKDEVAKNAAIAEEVSKLPFEGFVAGTDKGETAAKPEIWTEAGKFKSSAEKMQQEISKLAQAAKGGDLNAIKAQFGETGKACKACHDDFRKKS
jgi:cytochrome c556